jgi:IclR family transcriptional regulator, KDG regulon repressor
MNAVADNYTIQAVSRALELLEQFQEGGTELGITDLSNRLNLSKNNVFRLVVTLNAKKYLEINKFTGKYRLGIRTRALGQAATKQIDFSNHVRPFLEELTRLCRETCYFSIIKNGYSYYLEGVESDLPVRVVHRVGSSLPLYCTAAGKVKLAFVEPKQQLNLLSGTKKYGCTTSATTGPAVLQNELKKIALQGYAIDDQEHDEGVLEIAAPVFDSNGVIIGALSILGPEMRLAGTRLKDELLPLLCQSAARLSRELGYSQMEAIPKIRLQKPTPNKKAKMLASADCAYH